MGLVDTLLGRGNYRKGQVEVDEYWGFHSKIHVQGVATLRR